MVLNGNVSPLFGFSRGIDLFRLEIGGGKPTSKLDDQQLRTLLR